MVSPGYKRVLVKISGEAFLGNQSHGVDATATQKLASSICDVSTRGIEIALVLGGGNIFRGVQNGAAMGFERSGADQMGMLATLMNGIVLLQALLRLGCDARMMTALDCPAVAEKYQWDKAMRHLQKKRILLFVGGTGHPYFTTDTAAALRASEIHAEVFLKATTRVDGIYDKDPLTHKNAQKYESLSYAQVLSEKLGILDLTAVTLCMSNRIPIRVFNLFAQPLLEAISNPKIGTLVK